MDHSVDTCQYAARYDQPTDDEMEEDTDADDMSVDNDYAPATNHVSPGIIEAMNYWQIPTAQNWNELTQLLVGPKPNNIVLSPSGCFFAVAPSTMKVLMHSAQSTISLSNNTHNTHVTLDPWDIPTARDQNELTRLFAAPSAYSIVSYDDDFFAVKPAMMAILFKCVGATMLNEGPGSSPGSDSGSRNDDESILGSSLSNTNPGTDSGSRNDDESILVSSLSNTNPGSDSGSRNDDESILGSSLSNTDSGSSPGSNLCSTNDSDSGSRNDDESILGSSLSNSASASSSDTGLRNDDDDVFHDDDGEQADDDEQASQTDSLSRTC